MSDTDSDDSQATAKLLELWAKVIGTVNFVLAGHGKFGFQAIDKNLNPSLKELVVSLTAVELVLNTYLSSGLLSEDETRKAYNAKQCILKMRWLAQAVDYSDSVEYHKIIHDLIEQADF
jgi:hypothetical protein